MDLLPDWKFEKICEIKPEFLKKEGISLLLVDVDNTLAPYYHGSPSQQTIAWAHSMRASGIDVVIYSNNKTGRPEGFAKLLGTEYYVKQARKPRTVKIPEALEMTGKTIADACVVGDQIFTDVLLSKNAGCRSILVEPIKLANPLHILRFAAELPWRHTKNQRRKPE